MSPSNNDDAPGAISNGGARPLTRKELRALEKHTGDGNPVPEQAYETGHDVSAPEQEPMAAEPFTADPVVPAAPDRQPVAPAEPVTAPVLPDGPAEGHHFPPAAEPELHSDSTQHLDTVPPADATQHFETVQDAHAAPVQDFHTDDARHGGLHHEAGYHEAEPYAGHTAGYAHPDDVHYDDQHYDGHYEDHNQHGYDQHAGHAGEGLLAGAAAGSAAAKPSKKVRRRRRLVALFLTLVVFVAAIAVGAQFLKPLLGSDKMSDYPGPGNGEVQVSVEPGEGTRSVALKLETGKVVANSDTFLQAFMASGGTLSPGDYTFKQEMKNADAVNVLLGQDKTKVIYFALSAGLRIGESLQAISEGSGISIQQLKEYSDSPQQFGLPANARNLEGYLHPGEYRLPLGTPAKDILQSLVKTTKDELEAQGISDPAKQYEAVTVASIVQAEGGQAEYRDVAGAIYNRLKPNDQTNGYLQVDSAVTYGLGTRSFNFTEEERRDKSNPYNTYANAGLPPGPIGSPGKTAIDAAAKPKSNEFLYWVTINLDTKETKFSKTLAEHNVYVEQYNTWCRANDGRCA